MFSGLLNTLLLLSGIFLILIVLVQRGKGGGLVGALGGTGGYSAFGTRAGDVFTKITIGVAGFWILVAVLTVLAAPSDQSVYEREGASLPGEAAGTMPLEQGQEGAPRNGAGATQAPASGEKPASDAGTPLLPAQQPPAKTDSNSEF